MKKIFLKAGVATLLLGMGSMAHAANLNILSCSGNDVSFLINKIDNSSGTNNVVLEGSEDGSSWTTIRSWTNHATQELEYTGDVLTGNDNLNTIGSITFRLTVGGETATTECP